MAALKTHYTKDGKNVCGQPIIMLRDRSLKENTNTFAVTCGSCIIRNVFQEEHQKAVIAKEAAFLAQVPRIVMEPWREGQMLCNCGNDLFRYKGRSCMGHYDDWVCVSCGNVASRLTETGMCF